ncbi:hypothetical protein [Limnohabitans sp. WS1]|uniref:hypothetical protein n=1 Tax=Limnohabitans sp. WS1 TaxID=1100726 RepID=UPI000D3A4E36|nr:hypothetical protein [Limnohabitans sp. WS1]PUE06154.1 hypothetical protein B9Z48_20465 [Limnohabitans sp. WS1]
MTIKTTTTRQASKASERPPTAPMDQCKDSKKTGDEFHHRVEAVLENWRSWAKGVAFSGLMTPLQFFAVVLWVLESHKGDELPEDQLKTALSHWKRVIDRGINEAILIPLHGVSLLPVPEANQSEWVLSVGQLTDLMEHLPWAFDLRWALENFSKGADENAEEIKTWQEAAELHKSQSEGGKKPEWTHAKLKPICEAVESGVKPTLIAKKAGITRQALEGALKKYKANPNGHDKPDLGQIQAATSARGGAALQDHWTNVKAA